jgi:hypothetical protein
VPNPKQLLTAAATALVVVYLMVVGRSGRVESARNYRIPHIDLDSQLEQRLELSSCTWVRGRRFRCVARLKKWSGEPLKGSGFRLVAYEGTTQLRGGLVDTPAYVTGGCCSAADRPAYEFEFIVPERTDSLSLRYAEYGG